MTPREQVRLECLKLAVSRSVLSNEAIPMAKEFENYVTADTEAAPEPVVSKPAKQAKNKQDKAANLDPLS